MLETLTISDAAKSLQVATKTVRRLIERGELRAYKVGHQVRIRPADLERCMKRIAVYVPSAKAGEELD